jgi:hypothetical protein
MERALQRFRWRRRRHALVRRSTDHQDVVSHGNAISFASGASLVGALAALLALSAAVRAAYVKTIGRQRDRYRRLGRLGVGAQLSFFVSVLGEPPAIRRTVWQDRYRMVVSETDPRFDAQLAPSGVGSHDVYERRSFTESIFIDRDYYVQTISDPDESVLAYSVTARSPRFHPTYRVPFRPSLRERRRLKKRFNYTYEPLIELSLGRTRFSELDPSDPDHFAGPHLQISVGAHNWRYSEHRGLGNPGYYQTVVVTASDAAVPASVGNYASAQNEIGSSEWPNANSPELQPQWATLTVTQQFRRDTVITTYTAISMNLWAENYPSTFGPHINDVRMLP